MEIQFINKKGFSLGKAVVGGIVLNPILGAATGMIGKDKIIVTCLNCGRQFKAGHGRQHLLMQVFLLFIKKGMYKHEEITKKNYKSIRQI